MKLAEQLLSKVEYVNESLGAFNRMKKEGKKIDFEKFAKRLTSELKNVAPKASSKYDGYDFFHLATMSDKKTELAALTKDKQEGQAIKDLAAWVADFDYDNFDPRTMDW